MLSRAPAKRNLTFLRRTAYANVSQANDVKELEW